MDKAMQRVLLCFAVGAALAITLVAAAALEGRMVDWSQVGAFNEKTSGPHCG
jgi:hypothetical protein